MAELDELMQLFSPPPFRSRSADDWAEVESYVGSVMPSDFKAFLDAYGSGVISGELVIFHPQGSSPLLTRMRKIHESFAELRRRYPDDNQNPFHPEPGGLVSWGYDYSGDEHFFLPCDPDPERWKIVTMVHETGVEVYDGSFTGFVLAFVNRLRNLDRYHGVDPDALEFLEPEDLDELVESGEIGPIEPSFESF